MMRAKKRKRLKMLFRVGMVLCLLFFLIWGIHSWISPTIEEKLSYQAKNLVTEAVNKTVSEELKRMGITYHQMIQLTRDGTGKVTALQADTVLLNQIKSSITEQTMNHLKELSSNKLSIPLGSLTGWNILCQIVFIVEVIVKALSAHAGKRGKYQFIPRIFAGRHQSNAASGLFTN